MPKYGEEIMVPCRKCGQEWYHSSEQAMIEHVCYCGEPNWEVRTPFRNAHAYLDERGARDVGWIVTEEPGTLRIVYPDVLFNREHLSVGIVVKPFDPDRNEVNKRYDDIKMKCPQCEVGNLIAQPDGEIAKLRTLKIDGVDFPVTEGGAFEKYTKNDVTQTARFQFEDGSEVEIPAPGHDWILDGYPVRLDWPHDYVRAAFIEGERDMTGEFTIESDHNDIDIDHLEGRVWFADFVQRLNEGNPRVLWVQDWIFIGVETEDVEEYKKTFEFL